MPEHQSVPWSDAQLNSLLRVYSDQLADAPDDPEIRLKLAEVLRLLGKNDQAVPLFGSVAWTYAVAGNLAQAIVICKVILSIKPGHSQTQQILARLYASKRIRDAKRSVTVERQMDGRWVADPSKVAPAAGASQRGDDPAAELAENEPLRTLDANLLGGDALPSRGHRSRSVRDLVPEAALSDHAPASDVDRLAARFVVTQLEEADAFAVTDVDERRARAAPIARRPAPDDPTDDADDDGVSNGKEESTQVEVPRSRKAASRKAASRTTIPLGMVPTDATEPGAAPMRRGRSLDQSLAEAPAAASAASEESVAAPLPPPPPLDQLEEAGLFRTQHGLVPPSQLPRPTKPMPAADLTTLLRRDAEFAYREGRSTLGYSAIRREVADHAIAQQQLDTEPMDDGDLQQRIAQLVPPRRGESLDNELPVATPFPLFSHLDGDAFVSLVERLEARVFHAGELVIEEGEPGHTLLLVASGSLAVFKQEDGRELPLARLGSGEFFGEFALLTDQRRHASVRCETECEILVMRRAMLADLIRDYPAVQQTLRSFYQQRVLQMVLATSPLFQAVPEGERQALIEEFSTRRLAEGEVIVAEGEEGHAFYVVLIGEVAVTFRAADSDDAIEVGRLQEGDYFGEMSLISGYAAKATVRATRVTEVLALEGRTFYEMASEHPEIWAEVQKESEARARVNDRILAERKARALLL